MTPSAESLSQLLFKSLSESALLLDDLPESEVFPCHTLTPPRQPVSLNLQQKLGHLYEDALAVMLESSPRYDTLTKNLQIRQETGRTLGELDFLVKDLPTNQVIHLELAIKFYLAIETDDGVQLPGPDARDNFSRKLERMRSHQLTLTKNHHTLLPEHLQGETITVQHLVHGCIFNHVHAKNPVELEFLNPNGRRGKWLHTEECQSYFGNNTLLEIIPKPLWPAPLDIIKDEKLEPWLPNKSLDRCVMVRIAQKSTPPNTSGNTPYFIAPDNYPMIHS